MLDDLDEIHFTMKKARQVIRDMTRSIMTDKCIMLLVLVVVLGLVAIIVLNILKTKGVHLVRRRQRWQGKLGAGGGCELVGLGDGVWFGGRSRAPGGALCGAPADCAHGLTPTPPSLLLLLLLQSGRRLLWEPTEGAGW